MTYKIVTEDKNLNNFVINIQKHFKNSSTSIHKARNEIKVVQHLNKDYVIKSFKVPHLLNKIAYGFFRDSKAKRSYQHSIKINKFVPKALGYVEIKKFGLLYESYFISEKFNYDFTMQKVLFTKEINNKEEILKEFAYFTYLLHQNNVLHLDYSPGNILIKKESNGIYTFKIVDVNRMKFKILTKKECLHNFSKLWATDEDIASIIKYYAKHINKDEKESINQAIYFTKRDQKIKHLKQKLRGK